MGSSAKSSSLQTINHENPWLLLLFASLLPWQLRLMLMRTPTTPMATATATTLATTTAMLLPTDTAMDTATTDTPMPLDTTMARGLLMPSPLLMLMPTTATLLWLPLTLCPPSTEVPSTDLPLCTAVSTATTMARGLLMPSPLLPLLLKLMPMLTTTTGMPTTDTVSTMATLLPTMDTMDTPATTDIPTCTTATATPTITNLLIFVKN